MCKQQNKYPSDKGIHAYIVMFSFLSFNSFKYP